ncbi:MAG: hypothetical protein LDL38_11230 [Flavobacterium piscis]|nr:hypothetical protein [Flavobacterium piscis]
MAGKKVIMMQTLISISVNSAKLKKDFQKMSEGTRKIVDKILKQKIEHNVESKSNGKKVIK